MSTYYLHMTDRAQLRPAQKEVEGFKVARCRVPCGAVNRFFYLEVYETREW